MSSAMEFGKDQITQVYLFVVSPFSLPSYVPFTCPLSLGSMPSCPFGEGLLSQQSNYPTCVLDP